MKYPKNILTVCLGNICRSPAGEAVLAKKINDARLPITLDSAGTANYHIGSPPDARSIKIGHELGYDLTNLRARQVKLTDFYAFDLILAMDDSNLDNLIKLQNEARAANDGQTLAQVQLFDPSGRAVADPYYGDESDFVAMYAQLEAAADALLGEWTTTK